MPRPGRKPSNPRKLDVKLEFDTDEEGQRVRDAGGGPWIMQLVRSALGRPEQPRIHAELIAHPDHLELHLSIPKELIDADESIVVELDRRRDNRAS